MLALTRKADYALVALADLARRYPARLSARLLAKPFQLPLPMLSNILKELLCQGLVISTRGVNGGYSLARAPERITLAELIEAVEGPIKLTLCCESRVDKGGLECEHEDYCPIRSPVQKVNGMLNQFLNQITLADVVSDQLNVTMRLNGGAVQRSELSALTIS